MRISDWSSDVCSSDLYRTPMLVGYDVPLTVLSALIAVCLSGVGLWLVLRGWRLLGGVICGAMIGAMHYTGMAGFEGPFWIEWDSGYVAASLAIGVRSEEHTSELQSLMRISYAVLCLKKTNKHLKQKSYTSISNSSAQL